MSTHNQQLGRFGEDAAALWYLNEGYEILERNWRVRQGEIDLICVRHPAEREVVDVEDPDDWPGSDESQAVDEWPDGDWSAGGTSTGNRGERRDATNRDRAGHDLPMPASKVLVFVEVKTRTSDRFGGGYLAVDRRKQAKLRQLAMIWLGASDTYFDEIRFDVVDVNAKGHLHVWEEAF